MLKRHDPSPSPSRKAAYGFRAAIATVALVSIYWTLTWNNAAGRHALIYHEGGRPATNAASAALSDYYSAPAINTHAPSAGQRLSIHAALDHAILPVVEKGGDEPSDDVAGLGSRATPPVECRAESWPHLRAIVLTGGARIASLNRLLRSLVDAQSMGDRIDVDVWIDVPDRDRSSQAHRDRHALAHEIRSLKSNGTYKHGRVRAFVWSQPAGLRKQWLETWDRSTPCGLGAWTPEIGLILEDDLELSPHFWRWLKAAHAAYGKDPRVAGFTLQRASLCAKKCEDLGGGPYHSAAAFFYPLVGSWGYSPTVEHWIRFRTWYYEFVETRSKPYVEGLQPTEWYKSFEKAGTAHKRMWTMHHIKYADTHQDRYTVYVRCPGNKTLAQNHLEPGINYAKKMPATHERLLEWDDAIVKFPKFPVELDWGGRQTGGHGDCGGILF